MEQIEPIFSFNIMNFKFDITYSLVVQWAIIIILGLIAYFLTRNLKDIPARKQNIAEIFVEFVEGVVVENMGESYRGFIPFVGTLGLYLLVMNITGLVGIEPPTKDYNVTLGMALISFIVIQGYTIKRIGIAHYFIGFGKPIMAMIPMNLLERVMLPVSLSLRLFGNMTAAAVIMELLYKALGSLSWFAQLGLPVFLHFYFDIFDGVIQMVIFTMLTMINIKIISEH
ncbi:F0F1 ATP synthase subunit A [Clostridium amazonitimonense]|uniref:F0F1 ATP synthase subunit A n=1 Tax=Clostridium amazonitimonense TaxID=1499689 RepID=UPI000509B976|nr:F0F1 ATP synthase subunit A [Clostridium amazonitimonense]